MAKKAKENDEKDELPLPEVTPLPTRAAPGEEQGTATEPPPSQGQVKMPTAGRLIQYVTDERVVCPAIVTRVYKAKDGERDVVGMHVNALDPVYGSRTYHIPDAEAAHVDALLSNELRTVEEIDKDSEVLQPGTWTWPARE